MNLIKDSSFWWLQLNSTNSTSHSKPNRLFRNPMKLRAFFQSDNPTDLRHNETPLAPPKPSWAGGSGDDTWRTWKPWSQEIEKEAMTRRKRWKHWHFTGFFRTSWMNCFFQMYHCSLFYTPCTVSNLSFTDLTQGSIATHEIANQEILLVKAVPISQHQIHTVQTVSLR